MTSGETKGHNVVCSKGRYTEIIKSANTVRPSPDLLNSFANFSFFLMHNSNIMYLDSLRQLFCAL